MGSLWNAILSTRIDQSRTTFTSHRLETRLGWLGARLGSAPNRCSAWLRARFSARDTGLGSICLVTRFGLLEAPLSSRLGASQLGSARLAFRDSAHLGSWLGLGWGIGDQLNARFGSAPSSARGSAWDSAGDWLGNRDSVWLGSELS